MNELAGGGFFVLSLLASVFGLAGIMSKCFFAAAVFGVAGWLLS